MNASAGHARKFSGRTWYEIQIRERKRATWRRYPKKVNLMSEILALPSLRKEHLRKPGKIYKLKAEDKATFYSLVEIKAPVPVSRNTEERMFVVDSGASMHMLSKKDLSSR